MSAGLPHFSTGYMRCWGRDTFISLKGLLIDENLWNEAKEVIVHFASVVRHGLIPNLHD
jgi:glycogen debranching enzyme